MTVPVRLTALGSTPSGSRELVRDGVPDLFRIGDRRRFAAVEKADLAQQRVFRRPLRRAVNDADLVVELAHDPGQHPRIGRDAGAVLEREVEAVKIDAPAHAACPCSAIPCRKMPPDIIASAGCRDGTRDVAVRPIGFPGLAFAERISRLRRRRGGR